MRQYQVEIRADREESERIARLLDAALEDEGAPVSWFETPDGWAVDAWIFGDDAESVRGRVLDILR